MVPWVCAGATLASVAAYPWALYHPSRPGSWLGLACLAVAAGFWGLASSASGPFWTDLRCRVASLYCLLWGTYLLLFGRGVTLWLLDLLFAVVALLLWLGRDRPVPLLGSLGIVAAIGTRHLGYTPAVVAVDLALVVIALRGAESVQARLARPAPAQGGSRLGPKVGWALGAAFLVFFALHGARQTWLMVAPAQRRVLLEAMAPKFPIRDPKLLSPLAARLRAHVVALASTIGERSAYEPAAQERARKYVTEQLEKAGYTTRALPYEAERAQDFLRTVPYYNVEAVLPGKAPAWIVGAHYDSAPGTPGADDNASGVAVLLEAARMLKAASGGREIRFVAFGTEEPPAFGSRDMGSYRYARLLRQKQVPVYALLNLEMVGYFNPKAGSQLYPPFLHLFYPDRGDSLGLVSNLSSIPLMRAFASSWRERSKLTLHATVLPSVASVVALSDQLNFWSEGYPAIMLSDTSFFRYHEYHQTGDTAEKLDYESMAAATEAVTAILAAWPAP